MQDRRSVARNTGLILLAFVATLILLAGLVLVVSGKVPPSTGEVSHAPSGEPSETPSASVESPGVLPTASPVPATPSADDPVLVGAGDIGDCTTDNDEATAALLDNIPGTVFTLGDNAYPDGTAAQFEDCYDPTWGRHKERTRPIPGNHDYHTKGASAYLDYFGRAAVNARGRPLVFVRPGRVAHHRPRLRVRGDERLRTRFQAGPVARGRPRCLRRAVHDGDVACAPVQLRLPPERQRPR